MTVQIDPFRAINISRIAHQLKAEGRSVIHMEFGQPSTGAPPKAIAEAHARLDSEAGGYWEDPKLRERIARLYDERYGVTVDPDCVILTAGASPALVVALSVMFNPGDRIVTARPGYVAYRNTLKAMHMECIEIGCGPEVSYQMTGAALDAIEPAPQGVILASPANPTGSLIPEAELRAIAEVCARKNIQIISDEIYHGLIYEGRAPSMLEYAPQATVVNSFSKYWSMPGWRLGWVILPPHMVEQARARMGNMFLTPATLSQRAALVAMDSIDVLESYVDVYRQNRKLMLDALPQLGLATIAPPDGAFYIYADISHLTDNSIDFCERLLRATGVATAPGVDFDPVNGKRFIRFSFAVSTKEVEDAIIRMTPFFNGLSD